MSIKAAGMYLRVLREARGMGRGSLGQRLGIDHSQLERIEKGLIDTRGSSLMAIIQAVNGNPGHLQQLLVDKTTTEEDGRRLAEALLNQERQFFKDAVKGRGPEQWEYRIHRITMQGMVAEWKPDEGRSEWFYGGKTLDDLGGERWELVSVGVWEREETTAVFKRRLVEEATAPTKDQVESLTS